MQKKYLFLVVLIMTGIAVSLSAQSRKEVRWSEALLALEKSDFAVRYNSIKDTIEAQIAYFHKHKGGLSPEEVADVKRSYVESVAQFEQILTEIKTSFTDGRKRELIADHADYYSKLLETDLNNALQYYNNSCKVKIDSYIQNDSGALGLMEVGILITLGKELWSLWDQKQKKAKEMSAQYFEEHFVSKFRFKKWEHY